MSPRCTRWSLLFGLAAGLALLAPGCSGSSPSSRPTLHVCNDSDFIHKELLAEFEQRSGCQVQYDTYADDEELEKKLQAGSGYDVVFPSDKSIVNLVDQELLQELDRGQLSNWQHLDPRFLDTPHDPHNHYSAPYFWGTLAVGYRADKINDPVKGFEALFDERYRGHITMLREPEHVVAATLLSLGYPLNSNDDAHLRKVEKVLLEQKPLVLAYTDDEYKKKLLDGAAWVALGYSAELRQAARDNGNIRVVVPESGTLLLLDSMAIPAGTANSKLAHEFINFLLDPEIAARNANAVKYASPNAAARNRIDQALLQDPVLYPPRAVLDRCQWLRDRGDDDAKIERIWNKLAP